MQGGKIDGADLLAPSLVPPTTPQLWPRAAMEEALLHGPGRSRRMSGRKQNWPWAPRWVPPRGTLGSPCRVLFRICSTEQHRRAPCA